MMDLIQAIQPNQYAAAVMLLVVVFVWGALVWYFKSDNDLRKTFHRMFATIALFIVAYLLYTVAMTAAKSGVSKQQQRFEDRIEREVGDR